MLFCFRSVIFSLGRWRLHQLQHQVSSLRWTVRVTKSSPLFSYFLPTLPGAMSGKKILQPGGNLITLTSLLILRLLRKTSIKKFWIYFELLGQNIATSLKRVWKSISLPNVLEYFLLRQEHPEKITCPTCHTDCQLGQAGVPGLLPDYGVSGLHDSQLDGAYCTGCKSRESSAVARCFDCSNFLCGNCVMAHQVSTAIIIASFSNILHWITPQIFSVHALFWGPPCYHFGRNYQQLWWPSCSGVCQGNLLHENFREILQHRIQITRLFLQELDSVNKLISDGKAKASDIRSNLKNLEATSTR